MELFWNDELEKYRASEHSLGSRVFSLDEVEWINDTFESLYKNYFQVFLKNNYAELSWVEEKFKAMVPKFLEEQQKAKHSTDAEIQQSLSELYHLFGAKNTLEKMKKP